MFRRRRRKPRVQWLHTPGGLLVQNAVAPLAKVLENPQPIEIAFGTLPGAPVTFTAPMVIDNPIAETVQGASLGTYQNLALNQLNEFGWRLRRIVGNIFVGCTLENNQAAARSPGVLFSAAIIVLKVDDTGQPTAAGAGLTVGALENETDPYVWRRDFILSAGAAAGAGSSPIWTAINAFPRSNVDYGTKHHIAIDQKTARRIGPEERLFFIGTAWELPLDQATNIGGEQSTTDITVYVNVPYRVLGTVITVAGNRRNASR